MREGRISGAETIAGTQAAEALFAPHLAACPTETVCVAYLDTGLRLLHLSTARGVSVERVTLPLRAIMHDALRLGARAIILAHNHPGGSLEPSRADRRATQRLVEAGRLLDISILDHLIFAGGEAASFRELGLL